MGFFSRLAAFFGTFRRAATVGAGGAGFARGGLLWGRGQGEMLDAFAGSPHLHTVVQARAEACAAVDWQVWRMKKPGRRLGELGLTHLRVDERAGAIDQLMKDGELEAQPDGDLIRLLRRPSLLMGGTDFWELTSKHEDLVGEWLWLKAARKGRRPTQLHLCVPTWLNKVPDLTERDPRFVIQPPARPAIHAPPADVIWRRRHDPRDPYNRRGLSTAFVLRDEIQLDELLSSMARGRAANKNFPDLLIGLLGDGRGPAPGQAGINILTKLFEERHGGPDRVGSAHVISGDYKAQALGHTFVESQYMESRRYSRDTSMQTFRMPPELAGVLDNANRSTIGKAEDLEARRNVVPRLERWRAALQEDLVPDFGDDLLVGYRSPVPADREYEAGIMKALPGAFTINDIRHAAGRTPRPDGGEYYKAPGAVPVAGSPSSPTAADSEAKQEKQP